MIPVQPWAIKQMQNSLLQLVKFREHRQPTPAVYRLHRVRTTVGRLGDILSPNTKKSFWQAAMTYWLAPRKLAQRCSRSVWGGSSLVGCIALRHTHITKNDARAILAHREKVIQNQNYFIQANAGKAFVHTSTKLSSSTRDWMAQNYIH